jgi:chromodomain-helicase-DNA-binding protein 7
MLKPLLLRRMKEDVETLPTKEEIIVWVELTKEQKKYYRAIYENRIDVLMAGNKNLPNMRNVAMELRKVRVAFVLGYCTVQEGVSSDRFTRRLGYYLG